MATHRPAQRPPTILIVDDDLEIVQSIEDGLNYSFPNAKILTASSAEAAVEKLGKMTVDVIVTDYRMPGMNGLDLVRAARPRACILISAFHTPELETAARQEANVAAVLAKPFDFQELLTTIERLLRLPSPAAA